MNWVRLLAATLVLPSLPAFSAEPVSNPDAAGLQQPVRWAAPSSLSILLADHAHGEPSHAWARAVAATGRVSFIEQGVGAAKQALIDCQKGEYPGGGMGVLSLPQGRPTAITDHCRH